MSHTNMPSRNYNKTAINFIVYQTTNLQIKFAKIKFDDVEDSVVYRLQEPIKEDFFIIALFVDNELSNAIITDKVILDENYYFNKKQQFVISEPLLSKGISLVHNDFWKTETDIYIYTEFAGFENDK